MNILLNTFGIETTTGSILIIIATILSLLIASKFYQTRSSPLRLIPSPPGSLFFGHFFSLLRAKSFLGLLTEWIETYGCKGMVQFHAIGDDTFVILTKLEYAKKVLVSDSYKYYRPATIKRAVSVFGDGIFSSNGKLHAWQRKMLNPRFSHSVVKGFVDTFGQHTQKLVKVWYDRISSTGSNSAEMIVGNDLNHLTLDITCDTAFGTQLNTVTQGDSELSKAFETIFKGRLGIVNRLIDRSLPFMKYVPIKRLRESFQAQKVTQKVVRGVIAEKRQQLASGECSKSKPDLLEMMMRTQDEDSGAKFTEKLLEDNVFTFMVAGQDTTSTALTWTLYFLALDNDRQCKLREEVLDIMGGRTNVTWEDVEKMAYLQAVIKESMRLQPPAFAVTRMAVCDTSVGNQIIPKGTVVMIPIFWFHMSESFWRDPEKFQPERFLSNDETVDSGNAFFPFSLGPRTCIGKKFAMLEVKIVLAIVLMKFKFSISPDHPPVTPTVTLTTRPLPLPTLRVELC